MSLSYGFCLDGDDTEYTSKQFSEAIRQFSGDGVCDSGGKLAMTISGFVANLATGYVLTAGRWVENDEPLLLTLPPSGQYEDRTDAIAAVVDEDARKATIEILTDVDPDTPPDGTLYLVRVNRGSVLLNSSDVTDVRKYIIPLSKLSNDVQKVYEYLKTGLDNDVDRIIFRSKQEIYRSYISYEQLKGRISLKGGNPDIGELLTSCIRPEPENQWLLCNGGAVPEGYEALAGIVGSNLPNIVNTDSRFKTYIYGGQIGIVELPPVEPPIKPPVNPDTEIGKDWVAFTLPMDALWHVLGYGNGRFVLTSIEGIIYSDDGINWITSTGQETGHVFRGIAYGNGRFVLLGSGSNIFFSADAINWTIAEEVPVRPDTNEPYSLYGVAYGNGKFVSSCDNANKVLYSSDGSNWETSTLPASATWSGIAYGNGKFVILEQNGNKIAYSSDGINWYLSYMPSSASWRRIAYGGGKFVAICYNSTKFAYSEDGITWTESNLPFSSVWFDIAYGDGIFVAIAMGAGKATYSKNGIDWFEAPLPYVENWSNISYGDGKFLAVSRLSARAAYSMSSTPAT